MTNNEAINWLINLTADIGKTEHRDLWHYEQALSEIKDNLESERWISVSERLPIENKYVLATDTDGDVVLVRRTISWDFINDKETVSWWLDEHGEIDVIAWKPLPDPYKEII